MLNFDPTLNHAVKTSSRPVVLLYFSRVWILFYFSLFKVRLYAAFE